MGASDNLIQAGQRLRKQAPGSKGLINRAVGKAQGVLLEGVGRALQNPMGKAVGRGGLRAGKAVGRAGYEVAEAAAAPGGRGFEMLNEAGDRVLQVPGASALGLSTVPLALAAGGGLLYAARDNPNRPLAVEDIDPYTGFSSYQRLNDAYDQGVTPMSSTFDGFVAQKRAEMQEKNANMFRNLGQKGMGAFDELAKKLIMKDTTQDISADVMRRLAATMDPQALKNMKPHELRKALLDTASKMNLQGKVTETFSSDPKNLVNFTQHVSEVDPRKALGLGAAGLALGAAGMGMENNPLEPLGYKARKAMFSLDDRIGADELYAKTYTQQVAKDNAALLGEMVRDSTLEAQEAVKAIPRAKQQMSSATQIIKKDDVLSQASEAERRMLMRAFQSMQKFAPTLAGDEFAVRNYLREAYLAANGPDFGTLGNLARAERDVTGGKK